MRYILCQNVLNAIIKHRNQIARDNKEFRLGFLLAQVTGDNHVKHYLRSQLAQWDENNVRRMNKKVILTFL